MPCLYIYIYKYTYTYIIIYIYTYTYIYIYDVTNQWQSAHGRNLLRWAMHHALRLACAEVRSKTWGGVRRQMPSTCAAADHGVVEGGLERKTHGDFSDIMGCYIFVGEENHDICFIIHGDYDEYLYLSHGL